MDVNSVYNLWKDQIHGKYTPFDIFIFGLFLGTNKKYLEQKPDRALWWFRCSGYDNFQGENRRKSFHNPDPIQAKRGLINHCC